MKKIFLPVLAALLAAVLSFAQADAVPGEPFIIDDERIAGLATEVLPLDDGILVLGASEYDDEGWMGRINRDGSVRWALQEKGGGVFRCASALGSGGFAALIKRYADYDFSGNQTGTDETLLAFINAEGNLTRIRLIAPYMEWMIAYEEGYYLIGNTYDEAAVRDTEEMPKATLTRLDQAGETLWSYTYSDPAYSRMTFSRGAAGADRLIISGGALAEDGTDVATILCVDPDGRVLWNTEARAEEQASISDVCVTPGGMIAGCYAGLSFEEEMGFPEHRAGYVFLMDPDGQVQWEYSLDEYLSADYIVPAGDGFLVGSRGLDLENCPYLGDGWLLFLDGSGHAAETRNVPDIGGGKLELMGMVLDMSGSPLLFGALLEWPATVTNPFVTRLDLFSPGPQ